MEGAELFMEKACVVHFMEKGIIFPGKAYLVLSWKSHMFVLFSEDAATLASSTSESCFPFNRPLAYLTCTLAVYSTGGHVAGRSDEDG